MTDEHDRWKALEVRRPGDVPVATPLGWQIEKHNQHSDRLMNNGLPADFKYEVERGNAGDALAALALRESMHRDIEAGRGTRVHEAVELGATWSEVAAALDITPDNARALLRKWADGQHNLYCGDVERGQARPLGLSPEQYAAVLALCTQRDEGEQAGAMTPDPPIRCLVIGNDDKSAT